jgi:hypothetical protein
VSLDVEIAVNYLEIGPSVSEAELQPSWLSRVIHVIRMCFTLHYPQICTFSQMICLGIL